MFAGNPLGASMLPAYPVPAGSTIEGFLREEAAGLARRLEEAAVARSADGARRGLRGAPGARARGHLLHGIRRILLDRRRFHPLGARERRAGGPGPRLRRGLAGRLRVGITDLDPIEHDLLFERFLNPERVSMPDFDVDFCMEGRDRVIEYVANKYGRERVSQIITYGTSAAKAVVRDVGRVLGTTMAMSTRLRS